MKNLAAPQERNRVGLSLLLGLLLGAAALFSIAFGGTAFAASVTKGGTLHACYTVKGKTKGSLRVVAADKRCKKGERKLAWSLAGPTGPAGAGGAAGATGPAGAAGASGAGGSSGKEGSNAEIEVLENKVLALNVKLGLLENGLGGVEEVVGGLTNTELTGAVKTVAGLTNAELTGALGKLNGVTGTQLTETVKSLPVVSSLCTQTSKVTTNLGAVNGVASSVLGLPLISTLLPGVTPAETLPAFTCPS